MASYDNTRSVVDGHPFGARLIFLMTSVFGKLADWNDARVTRNALSRLSNHELDDLGLSRGDIEVMFRK